MHLRHPVDPNVGPAFSFRIICVLSIIIQIRIDNTQIILIMGWLDNSQIILNNTQYTNNSDNTRIILENRQYTNNAEKKTIHCVLSIFQHYLCML